MRGRHHIAASLFALLLGCSTADKLDFKAPKGWIGTPEVFGMQSFQNPVDKDQYILIAHPREARPKSHPASESLTPILICGSHPAVLMQKRGALGGKDVQMDGVDTTWNGSRVTAMYARPYGKPADPEAERAIRGLCIDSQ